MKNKRREDNMLNKRMFYKLTSYNITMQEIEGLTDAIINEESIDPVILTNYIEALGMVYKEKYRELPAVKEDIQKLCNKEADMVLKYKEDIIDESVENISKITSCVLSAEISKHKIEARKTLHDICRQRKKEVEEQTYLEDMSDIEEYDKIETDIRNSLMKEKEELDKKCKIAHEIFKKNKVYVKK